MFKEIVNSKVTVVNDVVVLDPCHKDNGVELVVTSTIDLGLDGDGFVSRDDLTRFLSYPQTSEEEKFDVAFEAISNGTLSLAELTVKGLIKCGTAYKGYVKSQSGEVAFFWLPMRFLKGNEAPEHEWDVRIWMSDNNNIYGVPQNTISADWFNSVHDLEWVASAFMDMTCKFYEAVYNESHGSFNLSYKKSLRIFRGYNEEVKKAKEAHKEEKKVLTREEVKSLVEKYRESHFNWSCVSDDHLSTILDNWDLISNLVKEGIEMGAEVLAYTPVVTNITTFGIRHWFDWALRFDQKDPDDFYKAQIGFIKNLGMRSIDFWSKEKSPRVLKRSDFRYISGDFCEYMMTESEKYGSHDLPYYENFRVQFGFNEDGYYKIKEEEVKVVEEELKEINLFADEDDKFVILDIFGDDEESEDDEIIDIFGDGTADVDKVIIGDGVLGVSPMGGRVIVDKYHKTLSELAEICGAAAIALVDDGQYIVDCIKVGDNPYSNLDNIENVTVEGSFRYVKLLSDWECEQYDLVEKYYNEAGDETVCFAMEYADGFKDFCLREGGYVRAIDESLRFPDLPIKGRSFDWYLVENAIGHVLNERVLRENVDDVQSKVKGVWDKIAAMVSPEFAEGLRALMTA